MPIWLRKFTFELIREHHNKVNAENDKQQSLVNTSTPKTPKINIPQPTYTTKASKK